MNGQPASIFQVEGVVVRDAHQGATFSYVTIREGERQYWDVACFEDGPLDHFRQLRSGAAVKVRGHLGKRKIKGVVDQSGRERYEIQLVASKLKALPALAPPPPQYNQPPIPPGWGMQPQHQNVPSQAGYNQQNPGWAGQQLPQQPPQHPGPFEPGDDLEF